MYQENTGLDSYCANTNSRTFGTFAVIYSRQAIPPILRWIQQADKPFDHMFKNRSKVGVSTRVAYPFLAIQDVRHASQIDQSRRSQDNMAKRAILHRWNLSDFCDTSGYPIVATEAEFSPDDVPESLLAADDDVYQAPDIL